MLEDDDDLFNDLDDVLKETDFSQVSATNNGGFENLPDGYYLCQVEETDLKRSKTSNKPMVAIRFSVVDDGYTFDDTDTLKQLSQGRNRLIFKNYPISDSQSAKRFVSDMMKFEDPNNEGQPLLPAEAWKDTDTLRQSIEALRMLESRIWVHLETRDYNGKANQWTNLVSFDRAMQLGLPVE